MGVGSEVGVGENLYPKSIDEILNSQAPASVYEQSKRRWTQFGTLDALMVIVEANGAR